MQNQFMYPGAGQPLYKVTGATGNVKEEPWTTSVPVNGYSETIGAHDCQNMVIDFVFPVAATGSILVEKVATQNAVAAGETFATETISAKTSASFNAGTPLVGFYRFKNTTNQAVVGTVQKSLL